MMPKEQVQSRFHILLIGGPHDGRRMRACSNLSPMIKIPDSPQGIGYMRNQIQKNSMEMSAYRLHCLDGGCSSFRIYIHEDLTIDEGIERLLMGFRRQFPDE